MSGETNTLQVTGKFDLKTILMFVSIIFGITGLGVGGFSLKGNVPIQQTVDGATNQVVDELRLLRGEVRDLREMRIDVQDNQDSIELLKMYQLEADSTNRRGLGIIWERQEMLIKGMADIRNGIDTLNQNPFF